MAIDPDNFKQVTDKGGHAAGDLVLRRVARLLRTHVRTGDVVARLGGDEFVMLFTHCPDPERVIDRLCTQAAHGSSSGEPSFEFSAGIARSNTPGAGEIEELLRRADQAMYVDKQSRSLLR